MPIGTGTSNKIFVSGITFADTREINPNVIDVANEGGFDDLMKVIDGYKATDQPNYHHFVNEDLFQILTFDTAGVSGSGTATLTVTITSTGFARRGLKLRFSNGKVGFINSAVTTASSKDSFTIRSIDGTNLTAVQGDKVTALGVIVGDGADEVTSLTYGMTKYFNLVEKLKDKVEITDIQKGAKVETGTGYWYYQQALNQAQSFKTSVSATLIGGIKSVNEFGTASPSLVDKDGNSMQSTGGVDQEINSYGVVDSVATPGTVLMSDVDDLLDQLNAVKGYNDYMLMCPDPSWRKYDDLIKGLASSGAISSARMNIDGKEVDYNVTKFSKGRFNLNFGALRILDHPQIFGTFAGAGTIGKTIYGIPTDKVKVQVGPSGKGGTERRIGVRYIPNQGVGKGQGTEMIREYYTGGLASTPTSGVDKLTCHITTIQGLEMLGTRQCFKQRVTA